MKHDIQIIRPEKQGQATKVLFDGILYSSINDFRRAVRVSETQVLKYKKEVQCSIEEVYDYLICKREKKQKERTARLQKEYETRKAIKDKYVFVYHEIEYSYFTVAVRSLNHEYGVSLKANYVSQYAKNKGITKQEALESCLEKAVKRENKRKTQ